MCARYRQIDMVRLGRTVTRGACRLSSPRKPFLRRRMYEKVLKCEVAIFIRQSASHTPSMQSYHYVSKVRRRTLRGKNYGIVARKAKYSILSCNLRSYFEVKKYDKILFCYSYSQGFPRNKI